MRDMRDKRGGSWHDADKESVVKMNQDTNKTKQ